MLHLSKRFDKLITGSFKKQASVFFIIVSLLLVFLTFFAFHYPGAGEIKEGGNTTIDHFWWVFLHFTYPGHLILDVDAPAHVRFYAWVVTFLGMLIFEGILVSIFVHGLRNSFDKSKKGLARYKFQNHYLIIGWDTFAISLIQRIFKENNDEKSLPEIVILSNGNIEELKQKIKSNLSEKQEKYVYVLYGELINEEFEKLCLNDSAEIYILGEGANTGKNNANLDIVFNLAQVINAGHPVNCFISLPEAGSFNLLKNISFPDSLTARLNLKPFNLYEGWARMLWESIDLKYEMKDNKAVKPADCENVFSSKIQSLTQSSYMHLVIVGFNEMGSALLAHTLQMAHFNTVKPTEITVIDRQFNGRDAKFSAEYPYYRCINDCKVHFIEKDVYCAEIRDFLTGLTENDDCRLIVAVCKTNPDISFSISGLLPSEILHSDTPVLVFQQEGKGYERLLKSLNPEEKKNRGNIRFFGWQDEHCDLIKTRELLAAGIHMEYLKQAQKEGYYDTGKPNFNTWESLPEVYKWSNRYQADSILTKICRINKKLDVCNGGRLLAEFSHEELELLARMEHDRWCAERIMNGWKYAEERNNVKKLHPDLVPFDSLSQGIKNYDYNAVAKIPYLLRTYCGLDVVPN